MSKAKEQVNVPEGFEPMKNDDKGNTGLVPLSMNQPAIAVGDELNVFSSLGTETKAEKMQLFNALTNTDRDISDCINETLEITDIIGTMVQVVDEETGVIEPAPRIILIDVKGVSYNSVSKGMKNAVETLIKAFGEPSEWEEPMKMKIKQVKVKRGSMLTFELLD